KAVADGFCGHPHDPAASPAVAKERAHRRSQIAVTDVAARTGPGKRDVRAEDFGELCDIFDRYRPVQRTRRREPREYSHRHAWQDIRERRRQRLEANPREMPGAAHERITPFPDVRRPGPIPPWPRPCLSH